jgi:hypothetical protein
MIGRFVCGSMPSSRSPEGLARSSSASLSVSSSGAMFSGMLANFLLSPSPCWT